MANYNSTHTGAEVDAAVTKANALPSATEINNKLAKALLTPSVTLQSNELVGVGTNGEQIRVQLGEGVTLEGTTSPYTLKATGGGGGGQLYLHSIEADTGFIGWNSAFERNVNLTAYFEIINNTSTPLTKADLYNTYYTAVGRLGDVKEGFQQNEGVVMLNYSFGDLIAIYDKYTGNVAHSLVAERSNFTAAEISDTVTPL